MIRFVTVVTFDLILKCIIYVCAFGRERVRDNERQTERERKK